MMATKSLIAERQVRAERRTNVSRPAQVRVDGRIHSARVHNLSPRGAMIETAAPLSAERPLTLCCGTLETLARIVWQRETRCGIRFLVPVSEDRIIEQLGRSTALTDRRRETEARAAATGPS